MHKQYYEDATENDRLEMRKNLHIYGYDIAYRYWGGKICTKMEVVNNVMHKIERHCGRVWC